MVVKTMDKEFIKAIGELLDEKLIPIKEDINEMKQDISLIKTQQEEQGRILRILEDKATTNKAEHDKLSNEMAHISEKVEGMRKDLATVEVVTARNMENIAQLKIIK